MGVEILSDYSSPVQVYVVNALETVQQFVAFALARDKVGMAAMLATDFKWMPVGELYASIDQTHFVNDMYDQFGTTAPIACRWDMQLSDPAFSRSTAGTSVTIAVPGSLAGRYSDLYSTRTRRWMEVLETWKVSLTDGKLQYFSAGARELYPGTPTAFTCTNMNTLELDNAVNLAWQTPEDPQLAGYRIYRGTKNDFSQALEFDEVSDPAATVFSADYFPGVPVYYWIVAYDKYGEVSAPSNPVLTGVPNEIRELAENFLEASYRKSEADVKLYTTVDFNAYRLTTKFPLESYCDFIDFSMAASPYELVFSRPVPGELKYELTFIVKGGGTICTWSRISCTSIIVQISSVDGKWKVFAATFAD
jgi:hypothetical protein